MGSFKANLAASIEDVYERGEVITFPKVWSPKLDGIRASTVEQNTLSRSRKPIANAFIRNTLAKFPWLDGEIIVGEPTGEGVYHRTQSAVNTRDGEPEFTFYAFDHVQFPDAGYKVRHETLVDRYRDLPDFIKIMPYNEVENMEGVSMINAQLLELGYEGMMLRNRDAPYKYGRATARSQDLLKVKPFEDREARIVGVYPRMHNANEAFTNELGRTDRSTDAAGLVPLEMIGGFNCQDVLSGVPFDCATGTLTADDLKFLWTLRHNLIGKQFVYRSMAYGVKEETGVPRSPRWRFKGWREAWDL